MEDVWAMITEGEARQRYSERLWEAYDALMEASAVQMECASGMVERAARGLSAILDEVAADGYYAQMFQHVRHKNMKGIAFIPIIQKERQDNALHERADSEARHKAEGAEGDRASSC